MQVFVVVLITFAASYIVKRLLRKFETKLEGTRTLWDEAVVRAMRAPVRALIWIVGLSIAIQVIQKETAAAAIFELVPAIRSIGVIGVLAWFLIRFIGCAEQNILANKKATEEPYDPTTIDAVSKLLRVSVIVTAGLVTLQTLGVSISGVLTMGGIGGLAVGFAAKDLLANFFGGLMIYLDRPFAVGDWIRSPDRDIEGTVEQIGWRLSCIRTFDSRPLYIPNAVFTNIAIENPSRMENRRIYETIGVRYDDAKQMRSIVSEVELMLRNHQDIDSSRTLMVNFDAFAPSSLDFFVYCFTKTRKWAEFHAVKQDVLLKILDTIAAHGAEVAFPTSTIHIAESEDALAKA